MIRYIFALLLLFSTAAHAQEEDLRRAAEAYVNSDSQQQLMDQMLSPEVVEAQLQAQYPRMGDDDRRELVKIAVDELAAMRSEMERVMIDSAIEVFTVDELQALTEFYASETGKSIATKMQPFMQITFGKIAPAMQKAQAQIGLRIQKYLQEKEN